MKRIIFILNIIYLTSCQDSQQMSGHSTTRQSTIPTQSKQTIPIETPKKRSIEEITQQYNTFFEKNVKSKLLKPFEDFEIIDAKKDLTESPMRETFEKSGLSTALLPFLKLRIKIEGTNHYANLNQNYATKFSTDLFMLRANKQVRESLINATKESEIKIKNLQDSVSTYYHFPDNELYVFYKDAYYILYSQKDAPQ